MIYLLCLLFIGGIGENRELNISLENEIYSCINQHLLQLREDNPASDRRSMQIFMHVNLYL